MKNTPPLISVLIVNYNGGELLSGCVRSVLLSRLPLEVRVADNASQDGSIEQLEQTFATEKSLTIQCNPENVGFAAAANALAEQSRGEYLLFLNPDCLLRPNTLADFYALMQEFPQTGMAGPLVLNPDGSEQRSSRREIPTPGKSLVRVLHLNRVFPKLRSFEWGDQPLPQHSLAVEAISGACMFVRRSAWQQIGPMDEDYFLHGEDLDWFMRFRSGGQEIRFAPHIQVSHAQGTCSQGEPLRVLWYKHRSMLRFYRKFFRHAYPLPLLWLVGFSVYLRLLALGGLFVVKKYGAVVLPRARKK